ncbi:transporter suffix domain-containing protein, partial [Lutimonas sp.]|uniref:transporter suffix domain-containing protein n=1 Tax=Lutimonas sp. TaxID=1872403 RepID=UPI003D9B504F
ELMKTTSLKSKIGIGLVIIGFICPLFGFIVPFLGFSTAITTALVTFFLVGGPEIFLLLGGVLAGKEGVLLVTNKLKKMLGLPEGTYPASKTQYNIGVALLILWFILAVFPTYILELFPTPFIDDNLLWFALGADVLLVLAIFGFGGHQMVTKISSVFKWKQWILPPSKEETS